VPSLHGVGTRGPLLHDGMVASLEAMFDPARLTPAFSGKLHGTARSPGTRSASTWTRAITRRSLPTCRLCRSYFPFLPPPLWAATTGGGVAAPGTG
jgi:hypothetical protein